MNRHYIEKIPPKVANADGADGKQGGKQGGKVFSIQLFRYSVLRSYYFVTTDST